MQERARERKPTFSDDAKVPKRRVATICAFDAYLDFSSLFFATTTHPSTALVSASSHLATVTTESVSNNRS